MTSEPKMTDGPSQSPPEDEAFQEAVRKTAYFLWEQDGRPHGRHDEYYLRALEKHRLERTYDAWLEDGGPAD
jgi:hypothetical protein